MNLRFDLTTIIPLTPVIWRKRLPDPNLYAEPILVYRAGLTNGSFTATLNESTLTEYLSEQTILVKDHYSLADQLAILSAIRNHCNFFPFCFNLLALSC
jgi:hypothetical protein